VAVIVAFDIDRTLDLNPRAWSAAIAELRHFGVVCIAVTCRSHRDRQVIEDFFKEQGLYFLKGETYYTEGMSKLRYMQDIGVKVDVWVDDDPQSVLTGK
jgi:hypothetical protein